MIRKSPAPIVMIDMIREIHHLVYFCLDRVKVSPRLMMPLRRTRMPMMVGMSLTSSSGCRKITTPQMIMITPRTRSAVCAADS